MDSTRSTLAPKKLNNNDWFNYYGHFNDYDYCYYNNRGLEEEDYNNKIAHTPDTFVSSEMYGKCKGKARAVLVRSTVFERMKISIFHEEQPRVRQQHGQPVMVSIEQATSQHWNDGVLYVLGRSPSETWVVVVVVARSFWTRITTKH